jgi:hypothetical protein
LDLVLSSCLTQPQQLAVGGPVQQAGVVFYKCVQQQYRAAVRDRPRLSDLQTYLTSVLTVLIHLTGTLE